MQPFNHQVSLFVQVQQHDTFLHQMEIKNQFQPNKIQKEKNARFGWVLAKDVIIIYALGSGHEKFNVWIKAIPESL